MFSLTHAIVPNGAAIRDAVSTPQLFLDRAAAVQQLLSDFVLPRIIDMGGIEPLADEILNLADVAGVVTGDDWESAEEWLVSLSPDELKAWALAQTEAVQEGICRALFDFSHDEDCQAFFEIAEVSITTPANSLATVVRVDFDADATGVEVRDGIHSAVDIAVEQGFLTAGYDDPAYVGHWTHAA